MRKFLSVIMVVAMLLSSILPAVSVAAADADVLSIELVTDGFVENEDGTVTADVDLVIANNPGFTDLRVLVYYTNSEVSADAFTAADAFADYASDSGLARRSTLAAVKSCFTAAGVATAASRYAADLAVNCYDAETGDPLTNTDTGAFGTLTISPADGAFSADMSYEIGVIVAEAYDAEGNEVAIDPVTYTQAITAKPENPYEPIYEVESFEDFTINLAGTTLFAEEADTANVRVELHGNTIENLPNGVWAVGLYVVYPEELKVVDYVNGDLFADSEITSFEDSATDFDLGEELAKINDDDDSTACHRKVNEFLSYALVDMGYEVFDENQKVNQAIVDQFSGMKMAILLLEMDDAEGMVLDNGLLANVVFQLPEDAEAGDRWDVMAFADHGGSICDSAQTALAAEFDNGYIQVVEVKEESFEDFTFSIQDIVAPATADTVSIKLKIFGNKANNPYGFWSNKFHIYYPEDLALVSVEEGPIAPGAAPFTFGKLDATKDTMTSLNAEDLRIAFSEIGLDYDAVEGFKFATAMFEAAEDGAEFSLTKDGHYLTLTFALPEGANVGDSWDIGFACSKGNAGCIGYKEVSDTEPVEPEDIDFAIDNGSITLAGEATVEPEPPVEDHVHELEYTAAVEAGCHYTGNTEYWYCAGCDTVFADADATQITNRKNVIIPAKGSNLLVHMDAVEAGCHYEGNVEYWICYECEQVWADEALTQLTNIKNVVLPAVGSENLHHVDYLAPTYEANGNIEYWYCDDCGQVWQDEALTQLTNRMNVIIPALEKGTVTVGTATVVKGENANVSITIDNNPGLFIGKFVITYDASILTLVEATNGDIFAADNVIINTDVEGQITLYFENNVVADVVANGVLANLVFATDAESKPVEVVLDIVAEAGNNINAAYEDVTLDVVAGKVVVINCNHEGKVLTPNQVKAPTVYEEGLMEYICECGEVAYTEAIAKLAGIAFTDSEMVAGEALGFVVEVLNNPGVWSLSATIAYDPNVLEFHSIATFDGMLFVADEYSYSVADGVITVYLESTDLNNVEGDGDAFVVAFKAISCGYSDIDLELVAENTINAAAENVDFVAIDGSVFAKCALTHSPYVAPTATENGWQEYWYCEYCGAVYADADGRWLTNRMNCYIPPVAIQLDSWVEVNEGEQAKVAVDLVSNPGVWAMSITVKYDAALTLNSIESGLFEVDEYSYSVADGVITIYVENAEIADVVDNGTAFTLVFDTTVGGYYDIDAELVAENTINVAGENVEFGVNDGAVTVFHVCSLEYVPAVEATCHQNGMQEYWYCDGCDSVYADAEGRIVTNRKNLVTLATAEIIHVEAVEAGCHYTGNTEYWYCSECDAVFADAALTQLTNRLNVVIPATGSENLVHFDAVEPGCHYDGNIEYWVCYDCEQVWQDEALTQLTNIKNVVLPAVGGEVIHVEAVEAGCHYTGNIEYWYCADCEQVWQDEALTQLTNIKNVVVPAKGSDLLVHMDAVEPGCHFDGNVEYWICYECEQVWTDEALTQLTNIKNVVIPATGSENLEHHAAVDATCVENGNIEYWYCPDCGCYWQDAALTQLTNRFNVIIPANGEHTPGEKVTVVAPTLDAEGVWEIRCSACGELLDTGSIAKASLITKASGTDYVKSVALNDKVINVVAQNNAPYVKIAVGYNAGVTVESANLTMVRSTYAYLIINYGEEATIVATDAYGNTAEYVIDIEWNNVFYNGYIGGYSSEKVEVSADNANAFTVYAKPGMNNVSLGLIFAKGVTYEASEGLEVVPNGQYVYFKALAADGNNTYTVTVTSATGATAVITINYVFDYQEVSGIEPGYMLEKYELAKGNVVNLVCDAKYSYASFKFALKNNTSTITWDEEAVDVVMVGVNHWFKVYNDGTNHVTTTMVITNQATGVSDTYTVNVTFGANEG